VTLSADDCHFSYRHSIFRGEAAGRYIITSVTLKLFKKLPEPPFYDSLQRRFDELSITSYTQQTVRDNVLAIRADKLPDPAKLPNAGSFFKNAIVEDWQANSIKQQYPDVKMFDQGNKMFKIPAGWLIEMSDLKGEVLHGMKVHDDNAVVLINESAHSYADLAAAREEIIGAVRDNFQIYLTQEPLELAPPVKQ
jgi:UDP-N-acetylmuramate dehydrogenase